MRSVGAIAAGYLIFALSAVALFRMSGQDPHGDADPAFMLTSVVYGLVSAVVGGYVAARLAARHPRRHAAAVAILIATGAIVSVAMSRADAATWSQFAAITIMAPGAALAGSLVKQK